MKRIMYLFLAILLSQCTGTPESKSEIYLGADLSYVNEMLDCDGTFLSNGEVIDPYKLFSDKGANIVRVRLWNDPDWTAYSNYQDVKRTIAEAKKHQMKVLLDFHYSDEWADPQKQYIPAAWKGIDDVNILGDSLYAFTYNTLMKLGEAGLMPEFVQVGNETNSEILLDVSAAEHNSPIDWERNAYLLKRGLQAVRDVSSETQQEIGSMLHIAQPENALWWFREAVQNDITDYDWIGLSYYPKWSEYGMDELSSALDSLKKTYEKRIMIVETAYPYGFDNIDQASNILGQDAIIEGYPATPQGQLDFMIDLTKITIEGGGEGVIYWEPAWISTSCSTRWGQGSHWENATFFDALNSNEALIAFDFFTYPYEIK